MPKRPPFVPALAVLAAAAVLSSSAQSQFLPIGDVKPGMVGIGRTVFAGNRIDEFKANILGVLRNVIGPGRDLILARLEGGPLATTGVMQGMSGSPVYVDGRLIGAVSYSLGSFPREPMAGITPIEEMVAAIEANGPRPNRNDLDLTWPATPASVFASLARLVDRAATPLRSPLQPRDVVGAPSLADWAPRLRPIGAAMVMSGFSDTVEGELRQALAPGTSIATNQRPENGTPADGPLRPGDAVGMSLMRGDLEMGATGTVTHVNGSRVYAFGHPFLNLGPTSMAMTRAHVYAVLPSLDSSMKIATLGPVIGTMSQDRTTAVGGMLGLGPADLKVAITLHSSRAADRAFRFNVLHDQSLTPLFAYVAILNALTSYGRQAGASSVAVSGSVSFGALGTLSIDDVFTGEQAPALAAASAMTPIGALAANEFRPVLPESLDLTLRVTEVEDSVTIERAWLDTTRPRLGATHTLHVMLRAYRGGTEVVSLPLTMPSQASGSITLLVADAPTLLGLEDRELRPGRAGSLPSLFDRLASTRRNNRLYVRMLSSSGGTSIAGEALPALPGSVRSVLDADRSVNSTSIARSVVGAWEHRTTRVVRGSRELTLTLTPIDR